MEKLHIGVVGAGTMGRGIVQLFAQAGHTVFLFDAMAGAVAKGVGAVAEVINKGVDKGKYSKDVAEAVLARIKPCATLSELAPCQVVIEAIIEEISAKQDLFAQLEGIVGPETILASNTSSLVVAEIAAKCAHPQRVAGLHFFNPVPLMKVVEVIAAVRTSASTTETLRSLVTGSGHRAVVVADQPGFLVNHAGRGYYTEALRILEEGVASISDVDAIMRGAAGFRMGPFELLDLTGLDVSGKVMESIYAQFQHEPRFRPSSLVPPRIAAGLLGRKTGEGWYAYQADGSRLAPGATEAGLQISLSCRNLWIDPAANQYDSLVNRAVDAGALIHLDAAKAELLVIQPWGIDASHYCAEHGLDALRCVAIDPLPGIERHATLMLTAVTAPAAVQLAAALGRCLGVPFTIINDSPGFVVQRVLATIINIAANIAQRRIAAVEDIEDAVKLGLGYPRGPLSWGDAIGGAKVLSILKTMQAITGDPRYRPSLWLSRRVALGLPVSTAEAHRP